MREAAVGRTIFEILYLRQEFDEVFQAGRVRVHEIDSLSNGLVRSYRITKMRMGGAEVTHVITIGEDITEWKRVQEQAEKLAAVEQLVAGVMHDIKHPMATIGDCAEGMCGPRGRIEVDSAAGQVSAFRIILPPAGAAAAS